MNGYSSLQDALLRMLGGNAPPWMVEGRLPSMRRWGSPELPPPLMPLSPNLGQPTSYTPYSGYPPYSSGDKPFGSPSRQIGPAMPNPYEFLEQLFGQSFYDPSRSIGTRHEGMPFKGESLLRDLRRSNA